MNLDYVYAAYGLAGIVILALIATFFRAHRLICSRLTQFHDQ